ncbi:MAG TPA: nuclear transport factor 2 family protein [Acidobacteriaceae bacterium]|nr:nuclear transport factor 2 family protein [Acidobacteriaceae bacterium]
MNPTLADELRSLEERLLDPEVRRDRTAVASLLAPDFLEFGSSGRTYNRDQILDLLASEPNRPRSVQLTDFAARLLAPHVALVTWRAIRPDGTQSLRSSVWIRREARWQMLFHQGTPIPAE